MFISTKMFSSLHVGSAELQITFVSGYNENMAVMLVDRGAVLNTEVMKW